MTAVRLPVSFSLACLATVILFWFLGVLIAGGPVGKPVPTIPRIDFTSKIPEAPEVQIIRIPPPIPKVQVPPEVPIVTVTPPQVGTGTGPLDPAPPGVFDPNTWGLPGRGKHGGPTPPGSPDRSALPQVRIEPEYPPIAKARGIEGWITFRFTVTREGRVKDIAIVDADPANVWDAAAIRAVSNWRYQPRMKDGVPIEQAGVTATYRFTLDR